MKTITAAIRELWGLFVEDASFTIGILTCIALAIFIFPRVIAVEHWRGPLLFGALALMLLENVRRSARR
jgi:hypothetical protein